MHFFGLFYRQVFFSMSSFGNQFVRRKRLFSVQRERIPPTSCGRLLRVAFEANPQTSDHSRRPAAQPGCAQPTCGPNSHRELTNHPHHHEKEKKEKKKHLKSSLCKKKLILNYPFYKIILNYPFYKIILNHPFFFLFFRGLGYSLDFWTHR